MRRGRLVVAVLAMAAMAAAPGALGQTALGGSFVDDDGSVHEPDIEAIAAEGITRGCNPPANDRFCPEDPVTRGQMAAFLVRGLGLTDGTGDAAFEDTAGSVFEQDIEALEASGVTRGCNPPANDRFCPDDPVTRGQMAAFLVRALNYDDAGAGDFFVDDGDSVFENDIDRLRVADVTRGCNPPANDRFCPDDPVTRGQMASFLARALELAPVILPPPPPPPPPTSPDCDGLVNGTTIDDDIVVPSDTTCSLVDTMVEGNIIVQANGTLTARGITVDGNVQGTGHANISLNDASDIDGNVQADNGGMLIVTGITVGGNIQADDNDGQVTVTGNQVDDDIQLFGNQGGVTVSDNTLGGNLQCEGNAAPVQGSGNQADGDLEGQCAGFG